MVVQALALRRIFEGPSTEEEGGLGGLGGLSVIKSRGRADPVRQAVGVERVDMGHDRPETVSEGGAEMPREGKGGGEGGGEGKGAGTGAAGLHEVVCLGGEDGSVPPRRAAPSSAPPHRPSEVVRIRVGTWNMGAASPDYEQLGAWLGEEKADLYAVADPNLTPTPTPNQVRRGRAGVRERRVA